MKLWHRKIDECNQVNKKATCPSIPKIQSSHLFKRIQERESKKESVAHSAVSLIATPAAKVVQLYGIDKASASAAGLCARTESFKVHHPVIGKMNEIASWSVIGYGLAKAGTWFSGALSKTIRPMLADIVGYTSVMVHPSFVNYAIRKIKGLKAETGMADFFQASWLSEIPAFPAFFVVLGSMVHEGQGATISAGKAVSAVLLSSIASFATWGAAFVPYWSIAIRKGEGGALKESGKIAATNFFVWSIPWYAVRAVSAAVVAIKGVPPEGFTAALFALTGALSGICSVLDGVKNMIVERILGRWMRME